MLRLILIIYAFTFLMSLPSLSQEKVFKGIVFDSETHKRIEGVMVTPTFNNSKISSNVNGRIELIIDRKYYDTLVFNHPDYYPFVKRVSKASNKKINFIELIPRSIDIDTICYLAYKENRLLSGEILDTYRGEPLMDAIISLENMQVIAYSDMHGDFKVALPRSANNIFVSHKGFDTKRVPIKYKKQNLRKVVVDMQLVDFQKDDTLWKSYKHIIEIAPLELIIGSLGIKYQYFISSKHCLGLQTSTYFAGNGPGFNSPSSKFTGFKFSPSFRYYESRLKRKSTFLEAKIISGYFDFSDLFYSWRTDKREGEFVSDDFWSFGVGAGLGWSSILHHSKHAIITIYAGVQFFPMKVPDTIQSDNFGTLDVSKLWWYIGGPGSTIEVKVIFGGIF